MGVFRVDTDWSGRGCCAIPYQGDGHHKTNIEKERNYYYLIHDRDISN